MFRYIATAFFMAALVSCSKPQSSEKARYSDWKEGKARALYQRIAEQPNDASGYYALGYAACHIKDVQTVRESYRKAIELDPANEWYKISYGWALFNAEAYDEALPQWLKAYEFCHGQHEENNITVALGYYGVGNFEKAAEFYSKQVERDPHYGTFKDLQEATAHWTWPEKEAVYRLYDIYRYSYGRKS